MESMAGERRQTLSSELAQMLAMARELEAHMDQDTAAARELCRALASSIDKSIRIVRACCPESPPSAAWSPRSSGRGAGDADGARFSKRKGMAKVRRQVRVRSVQDVEPLDDGLSWRKYGQKDILGAKYPRAYFRCTHRHSQGCQATKQVQRADGDPLLFDVVYNGAHTCAQAAPPASAGDQRPPSSTVNAEQQQLLRQFGHDEMISPVLAVETDDGIQGVEHVTPFLFPSTPAGIDGGVIDNYFPFASPANSDCQLGSSNGYLEGDLGVSMNFEIQEFDEFFSNHPDLIHSEIHM